MDDGIILSGIDGSDPLHFLCTLGILTILDARSNDQQMDRAPRVTWKNLGKWSPVFLGLKSFDEITVVIFQNIHTMTDCLDVCKLATFAESLDTFAKQFEAVTGIKSDADHLLKAGERVFNLERYYNNLLGFGEGSDYLPERFLKEPSTMGGSKGHVCELDQMLEEYYEKRGWVNGVVPEEKLKELEII